MLRGYPGNIHLANPVPDQSRKKPNDLKTLVQTGAAFLAPPAARRKDLPVFTHH
jgi:hypothetical protein